jgi:VanZ family protein
LDKKRKDLPGGQGAKKTLRHWFLAKIGNLYWKSGLITGLIGLGDEIYQHFLPRRYFAWYDIFLNILGGIVGLVVFWALKK